MPQIQIHQVSSFTFLVEVHAWTHLLLTIPDVILHSGKKKEPSEQMKDWLGNDSRSKTHVNIHPYIHSITHLTIVSLEYLL